MPVITEQMVLEELAVSSHQTYIAQKSADLRQVGKEPPAFDPAPTDHDHERAQNAVAVLKRLGIVFPLSAPERVDYFSLGAPALTPPGSEVQNHHDQ